jgi:predicted DNA-binding protein (MmcQ/YjbR family)
MVPGEAVGRRGVPVRPRHLGVQGRREDVRADPLDARPLTVSLKCEPSLAEALRAEHPAVRPGYHLNKRHWITVTLDDSLPDELVLGLLEDSYELVVGGLPKRERDRVRLSTDR